MLDFNKDETELKTMTAHVILSFDNVIHEHGTQEIFYADFAIENTCEETVYNMLLVINQYIDFKELPKSELWKISTAANWSKIASQHNFDIQMQRHKWKMAIRLERMHDRSRKSLRRRIWFWSRRAVH